MPYSLILHCLSTSGPIPVEDRQGQKALAMFLQQLIASTDTLAAARLHAHANAKPFTTAILPSSPQEDASLMLRIRCTLLDDDLFPLVSQYFLRNLGTIPCLRLGKSTLQVARLLTTEESGDTWAGCLRFADLLAQADPHEATWPIVFVTPTAFRMGDAEMPLPLPRLCFQSWLNSWEEHAPQPFFPDKAARKAFLTEVVEAQVSVHYAQLRLLPHTLYFDGKHQREHGFLGACQFRVQPRKVLPQHRHILGVLARYSFFAGTGHKTTMGMGVTRYNVARS